MVSFSRRGPAWVVRTLLLVGFSGVLGAARAQQLAPVVGPASIRLQAEDLERGTNGPQSNFYFLPPGVTGENYQSAGFFGQRLRPYLAGNSEALGRLNDYRRQKSLFLAERLVFVGAVGLYGQQVLAGAGSQQYFNPTQRVAIGVAAASLLANVFITRNTSTHLRRAVDAYNADVEAGARGARWQRLRPSRLGLAATPAGQPLLALGWTLR